MNLRSGPVFASLACAAALLMSAAAPANAYIIYTSRAAWQAAVDGVAGSATTTDTFSNAIGSAQSITLDSGIVSTNSSDVTLPNSFQNNSVSGGVYNNALQSGSGNTASHTLTWAFPSAHVFAFGADFINVNTGRANLTGNFDGTGDQTILLNDTIGGTDGFLGVVGQADFGSVIFGNASATVDAFSIDNASFATPEPGVLSLLGLGLVAAGVFRKRKHV